MNSFKLEGNIIFFLYVVVIVLANFTGNMVLKLPLEMATTVGTLVFGVVFTLRDLLHKQGVNKVYLAIAISTILAFVVNYLTNSSLQIIFASVIALAIGELADTRVFQAFKSQNWLARSTFSNIISIPIDSILFNFIAFWGSENQSLIGSFVLSDLIIKFIVATVLALGIFNFYSKNNSQ